MEREKGPQNRGDSAVLLLTEQVKIYSVWVVRRITSSCMVGESLVK